jgi:hypothetical protein
MCKNCEEAKKKFEEVLRQTALEYWDYTDTFKNSGLIQERNIALENYKKVLANCKKPIPPSLKSEGILGGSL